MAAVRETHDTEGFHDVVERLAQSQKSMRNAGAWSRWVNRPLGRRMAAFAYLRGLTPNQVTAISAMFTFTALAVIMLVRPSLLMAMSVSAALVVGHALDAADGQLARLRGGGSPLGEWLDHVTDSAKNVIVHLAVLVSWYRFTAPSGTAWLIAPLAFSIVSTVMFFAMVLIDQLRRSHGIPAKNVAGVSAGNVNAPSGPSLLLLPTDYGLLCVSFVLLPWPGAFKLVYTIQLVMSVGYLAARLRYWLHELSEF